MKNKLNIIRGKFLISVLAGSILLAFSACGKEEVEDTVPQTEEMIEEELTAEEIQEEEPAEKEEPAEEEDPIKGESKLIEADEPELIPEDLLVYLEEAIFAENRAEMLKKLVSDRELTRDEIESYLDNPDVAEFVKTWCDMSLSWGYAVVKVDGDNDGIEDLVGIASDGGSAGGAYRFFFKGQEDGTYEEASVYPDIMREFAFIEWDGKNYLLQTDFDYALKEVNGLVVACYEDGEEVETIELTQEIKDYEANVVFVGRGYQNLVDQWAEKGKGGFLSEDTYGWEMPIGSSEQELKEVPKGLRSAAVFYEGKGYAADIDNDGIDEWYVKNIFYPSSMGTQAFLECYITHEAPPQKIVDLESCWELEYEGVPLLFWVEYVEGIHGQIVCLMCYDGLSTNRLYGYLIQGEKITTVFEVEYKGNIGIERRIWRRNFDGQS